MNKNKFKKILVASIILLAPIGVSAKTSWGLRQEQDNFSIQGECLEKVKIELFEMANDKDPVFDFNAQCESGNFYFSNQDIKKNIPGGNYLLAIDGEKSPDILAIKKKEGQTPEMSAPEETKAVSDPDIKFLGAMVSLQQAILDMQIWLAETKYPQVVKDSLDLTLNGLQSLANKLTDLIWSSETGKIIDTGLAPETNAIFAQPSADSPDNSAVKNNLPVTEEQAVDLQTGMAEGLTQLVGDSKYFEAGQPAQQFEISENMSSVVGLDVSLGNTPMEGQ